jgi:hypothetical protein
MMRKPLRQWQDLALLDQLTISRSLQNQIGLIYKRLSTHNRPANSAAMQARCKEVAEVLSWLFEAGTSIVYFDEYFVSLGMVKLYGWAKKGDEKLVYT